MVGSKVKVINNAISRHKDKVGRILQTTYEPSINNFVLLIEFSKLDRGIYPIIDCEILSNELVEV